MAETAKITSIAEPRSTAVSEATVASVIRRLRAISRDIPMKHLNDLNACISDLQGLRRELAESVLARSVSTRAVPSRHAPGHRRMGPKRRCPAHNAGEGAMVSVSRFRPGKSVCRQCESRHVRVNHDGLTFEVLEGDRCVGEECPLCGFALEIGERLHASDLCHEKCWNDG